jgi:hypothetical protein
MDDLLKFFELMRSALLSDNNQVVMEVCDNMIAELDLRSVDREGYDLSCEIGQRIDLLISCLDTSSEVVHCLDTQEPNDEDGDPYFLKHVMWTRK